MTPVPRATELLEDLCRGDESAAAALLPLVYGELRQVAAALLQRERPDHTLQPTALVHEAWLRLIDQRCVREGDEAAHRRFVGLAARAMRQVLVEHARRRRADKRGGEIGRVSLPDGLPAASADPTLVLDLEAALDRLQEHGPRLAQMAELRIFGGLSLREAASVAEVSLTTAKNEWTLARAWLTKMVQEAASRRGGRTR